MEAKFYHSLDLNRVLGYEVVMLYVDYNATTPLSPLAISKMTKAFEVWGNPSSSHELGRRTNQMIREAREAVAKTAHCHPDEVVFTSGGSEANVLSLMGSWFSRPDLRLLTSAVEHSSIRDFVELLARRGNAVQKLSVDSEGQVSLAHFEKALDEFKPHLVSLMTANNETGVVFPIPDFAEACKKRGIIFHTDAVQAFGKLPANFYNVADMVSISAHKIYGPKGIGALILKKGTTLTPTHFGGAQEIKRRGGTENVIGICGFGGACEDFSSEPLKTLEQCRNAFETRLMGLPGVSINGGNAPRLPTTSNVRFEGIPSEVLLSSLDLDGVFVSAGSACSSGSIKPSHVLLEMGLPAEAAKQCVRFSWGIHSKAEEFDRAADSVIKHVSRIRDRKRS